MKLALTDHLRVLSEGGISALQGVATIQELRLYMYKSNI